MIKPIASIPLTSEVFVVELDDGEVLLGHLAFGPGTLTVFSGFAGRPRVLDQEEVVSIVPASTHSDVDDDQPEQDAHVAEDVPVVSAGTANGPALAG